jgi:signal peptidase II
MLVMQTARGTPLKSGGSIGSQPGGHHRLRIYVIFVITAAVAYLIDLGTKILAVEWLTGIERVEILGGLLSFNLTRNPGAAFSTGTGFTQLFTLLAVIATLVVLWLSRRLGSVLWACAMGLLLAGITGNLTDRIFRAPGPTRGHVVDFIQLPHWPIFNVADVCLNVGVALVLIQTIRGIELDGTRQHGEQ